MDNFIHNVKTALIVLFMATALAACGGGSGGGGDDPATGGETPTTPNPPPAPSEPVAGSAVLSWDTPGEREDGEPLFIGDIGGYEINYRLVGDGAFTSVLIADGTTSEYTIEGLEAGSYEIYIYVFDNERLYSAPSDAVMAGI